jgi:hypothetical protein
VQGFAVTFEIAFKDDPHPALDETTVDGIRDRVFGSDEWTFRR